MSVGWGGGEGGGAIDAAGRGRQTRTGSCATTDWILLYSTAQKRWHVFSLEVSYSVLHQFWNLPLSCTKGKTNKHLSPLTRLGCTVVCVHHRHGCRRDHNPPSYSALYERSLNREPLTCQILTHEGWRGSLDKTCRHHAGSNSSTTHWTPPLSLLGLNVKWQVVVGSGPSTAILGLCHDDTM